MFEFRFQGLLSQVLACLLGLFGLSAPGLAATSSFQGDFSLDNDLAIFAFELVVPGDIAVTTFSHSGGVNAAGQNVAAGGFAPVLTLFDADGYAVHGNAGSSNVCAGAGSFCWDASFSLQGAASGHYLLVLSQDDNNVIGGPVTMPLMASFFSHASDPHYTSGFAGLPDDDSLHFVRIDGDQRSGHWALDVDVAATVSQVPELATVILWPFGLVAGLWLVRRREA
ncbi:DVUA0089 family protein [Roseateles albus]|uniref:DVUA0089 family protein n=1 Tax=Roseateles albus TaxID=2987525 RepID=A0ABT5KBW2_9BURK|nr:DVUA0089 family protein [Roseateles albus]MDC8771432.1 DVUA0089 family protein [Roseateles albus]